MLKSTFVIQARLGSSRLPNKIILPFYKDKCLLEILLEKLKRSFPYNPIVLATSINPVDDRLISIPEKLNIPVYRGSESNVLSRFIGVGKEYGAEKMIRICSDNPFLDMRELRRLLLFLETNDEYDYVSFDVNNTPSILTHFGFWTEFVSLKALEKVNELTHEKIYQEHVTNFIYTHPSTFKVKFLDVTSKLKDRLDIRMTLDTEDDFSILSKIYKKMNEKMGCDNFGIEELLLFLDSDTSNYKNIMIQQIEKNSKK